MKERGPWRLWSIFLLILAGSLSNSLVQSQSYDGARGDSGDSNVAALGFSGVVQRHDGYVKGETPTIPQTSFSCSAQPYNPGLYADVETQCQVYHVCFEDRQESFLCGPGTNFNQRILACDFWYNFDCQDSPNFYSVNADIGKVPETAISGERRQPGQTQTSRPSYPSFPQQPAQPPSGGSYPSRVSVPPPPPRPAPQPPRIQPQPPRTPQEPIHPQPPRFTPQPIPQQPDYQPEPPRVQPQPPRIYPEAVPQPPRVYPEPAPQPPRVYPEPAPQPPRVYPEPAPQPPRFYPEPAPQPPRVYPEPAPQPPRVYPEPAPKPPAFKPDPPRGSGQPTYPRVSSGSGQPPKVRPPPPQLLPPTQQEEDAGYQFDGYRPPIVHLPPPTPSRVQTPKPVVFPPVVSPPRVSRPPLTPPIIRQPEISRPRIPTIDTRSEFHPDSHLKGNVGYQPPQQPRVPQPSRPIGSGYPSYPVAQRPVVHTPAEKPRRPAYKPPATVQQEHVDTEYIPPPPPPPPKEPSRPSTSYIPPPPPPRTKEPSRPSTSYVPPPPPPVQQEVTNVGFTKPPQQPSRPVYVPPPVAQKPVEREYIRPQPPVAPSIIREQQKPASLPPRPQVTVGVRQPQPPSRPKPVFPPASDHPNSNIKGGPGYNQPPPQVPRFEPTRISRPSSPQGGYQVPPQSPRPRPITTTAVKPTAVKTPSASGQGAYKPPEQRIKKPSDPPRTVYQPPIQVIDHPRSEIKGVAYDPSRQPQRQPSRQPSPSIPVSGIKRPQVSVAQKPHVERPRAPVVVARPQPPSLPTTSIKKTSPVDTQVYEKPRPQPPAPSRVKQPSTSHVQAVSRPSQPRFPSYDDHPNANVKGGSGYTQQHIQPIGVSRPAGPPSAPSTSYEQKTTCTNQGRCSGGGYPSYPSRGDGGSVQQVIHEDYKPSRSSPPSSVKTVQKITHVRTEVKDTGSYQRPPASSHHSVLINKQSKPDYEAGSSYTRGPETYPKPEFGKPHTPVSTPSRISQGTKQGSPSQNTITRSQNKPVNTRPSVSSGSGSGSDIQPDYPFNRVPGHQPPHERQVFPHRENPDHPNESIKGSGAYRPPPPAGFQAAASEVEEQKVVPEPEPDTASLHGDTGSE